MRTMRTAQVPTEVMKHVHRRSAREKVQKGVKGPGNKIRWKNVVKGGHER